MCFTQKAARMQVQKRLRKEYRNVRNDSSENELFDSRMLCGLWAHTERSGYESARVYSCDLYQTPV